MNPLPLIFLFLALVLLLFFIFFMWQHIQDISSIPKVPQETYLVCGMNMVIKGIEKDSPSLLGFECFQFTGNIQAPNIRVLQRGVEK